MSSYLGGPQNLTSFHNALDGFKRKPFEDTLDNVKRRKADADVPSYAGTGLKRTPSYDAPPDSQTEDAPVNKYIADVDQHEEDELSKIDWSNGRRRTIAGLLTCLYDRRREREFTPQAKPVKKKVRFVRDEKLVKTRFFEMDEEERANVYKNKIQAEQLGIDLKQLSAEEERRSLEQAAQNELNHHVESTDENPWFSPPRIARLPAPLVERGFDSVEKLVFHARQMTTLSALYLNRENLPDSPEEPTESLPTSSVKHVLLVRPGMNMKQPLPAEIIPSGPLPEVPELPPAPAPVTPTFTVQPVTAAAPVNSTSHNTFPVGQLLPPNGLALPADPVSRPAQLVAPMSAPKSTGFGDIAHSSSAVPSFAPSRPSFLPAPIDASFRAQGSGNSAFQPSFNGIPQYQVAGGRTDGYSPIAPAPLPSAPSTRQPDYRPAFPAHNVRHNGPAPPVRHDTNGFRPHAGDFGSRGPQQRPPARVCQYQHLPGGCRNGNACRFLHVSSKP
ncbi:serine/threonine-protein phosphatase 1 regulatory subunit 10-like [Paramacrobiotus metropolitanus]|uniref:serine/threonine-protein phosphatase 1 regulatory subunit 10-like n=1 Tax=Paramacrobiotus metropolitanus TaxID=2943436 RepID=UPI0024456533|nr:serine/threonine-protein phosphatase 1 regulatory subunit 10-like [Paramacrobiotus metropolitanus]